MNLMHSYTLITSEKDKHEQYYSYLLPKFLNKFHYLFHSTFIIKNYNSMLPNQLLIITSSANTTTIIL